MSILVGPFKRNKRPEEAGGDEEDLLVFGYACKLYRDEAKALLEDSGQLLIPWMGDHSLMVDRYDVRNRLEDKNQFGLKSNLPYRPTAEEVELEEELDYERYLALERDDIRVAEQEEEEKKRQNSSSLSAVGFNYNNMASSSTPQEEEDDDPPMLACYPQQLEHPPTSSVDQGEEEEEYVPPVGLIIPNHIKTPTTNKLHSIIEKTAFFIAKQGVQMEIIIKAKQKFNPFFSFLDHNDALFPYYQHVKEMLTRGAYVPRQVSPAPPTVLQQKEDTGAASSDASQREDVREEEIARTNGDSSSKDDPVSKVNREDSSSSDEDSDDDDGYLHPLLMGGGLKNSSKSSTPNPPDTSKASPSPAPEQATISSALPVTTPTSSVAYTTSSIAFYSKRLSINSAPMIDTRLASTSGPPRVATSTSGESSAGSGADAHHQMQYSSGQPYPPHSSMVERAPCASGRYEHGYGYESHTHNPEQAPPPNAYMTQHHQYTHDGVYYDSTGAPTTAAVGQEHAHYDYQAYYYNSAEGGQYDSSAYSAPPPAPPPDILPVVTKTAEYVAKNGNAFERTVIERHAGDPRFGFLNPWDKSHAYYQALKQQNRQRIAYEAYAAQMGLEQNPGMGQDVYSSETSNEGVVSEPTNLQRLSEWGTVSFKLQAPKPTKVFDRSSLVDLGTLEDVGEEGNLNEESVNCNGVEEDEGEPASKKARLESTKMGTKVEEFLSTVKAMLGTE